MANNNAPDFIPDDEMPDFIPDDDIQQGNSELPIGMIGRAPILSTLARLGQMLDPYTGAPTRSALKEAVTGGSPIEGFTKQFGMPSSEAPTGSEIAGLSGISRKGLSEYAPSLYSETGEGLPLQRGGTLDVSPADIAGFGIDVGADWTNLVSPILAGKGLLRPAAKGTAQVAKTIPKATAGAIDLAMMQSPGKVIRGETAARKTVSAIGDRANQAIGALEGIANPRQVKDYEKMAKLAKDIGIMPENIPSSVEFGPSSFVSRAERFVMEGPSGEAKLEKFYDSARKVDEAIKNTVTKGKSPISLDEAGKNLISSYNGAVDGVLKDADITYKKVQKFAPGLMLDKAEAAKLDTALAGIEKRAKGLVSRGITKTDKEQGAQLLRAVSAVRKSNGSFKQTVEALDMIGKSAFSKKYDFVGDVPPLTKELQQLYFKSREAVINTVDKHVSKDMAQELVKNNSIISDLIKNEKQISSAISANTPNEKRISQLFSDTNRIESAKKILPKADFDGLASDYVMSTIPRNAEGAILPNQLKKWIRKEESKLNVALSKDQLQKIKDLSELGSRFGAPVLSTSGTGASNSFRDLIAGVFNGQTTDSVVEALKARGRGRSSFVKKSTLEQAASDLKEAIPGISMPNRFLGKRENQLAQFLKGSQVLGVQSEEENRRLRRLKALQK